ncbi:unnamed protein product [Bemisia tabaci]|uniref:Uncharacterized protein n=1 Tax=Bemisia tabaci TaxID=7038 RepID=A0A9P0AMR3_BEMTA|nr:unnamed protein product [Bemisia tabaci]
MIDTVPNVRLVIKMATNTPAEGTDPEDAASNGDGFLGTAAVGIFRSDRVRNERVRHIMGVENVIVFDVMIRELDRYGHFYRMTGVGLPRKLLDWVPRRRRRSLRVFLNTLIKITTECLVQMSTIWHNIFFPQYFWNL